MGLVLLNRVSTFTQLVQRPDNLWDILREFQKWQHRLSADFPHEVSAARAVAFDELKVGSKLFLHILLNPKQSSLVLGGSVRFSFIFEE